MAQRHRSDVHWKAPVTIVVTFILGLLFAIGHHVFYHDLDGKLVDSNDRLFGQQINISIGTAFAFLFRACLSVSIGATYWQVFWRQMLRKGKSLPVAQLDSLAGLLGSIFEFLEVGALLRYQGLALLAALSWLIPLAALLPPATLAVENVSQTDHVSANVPAINFTSTALMTAGTNSNANFLGMDPDDDSDDQIYEPPRFYAWVEDVEHFQPGSASLRLIKLMNSVAMGGAIPSFPGVGINTTFELQFPGPAIKCRAFPDFYLKKIPKLHGARL